MKMSLVLNIVNMCRVCMRNDQNNERSQNFLQDSELWNQFYYATHIKVLEDDNLPKMICAACRSRLLSSYKFIRMARESETSLKNFLLKINDKLIKYTQNKVSEDGLDFDLDAEVKEDEVSDLINDHEVPNYLFDLPASGELLESNNQQTVCADIGMKLNNCLGENLEERTEFKTENMGLEETSLDVLIEDGYAPEADTAIERRGSEEYKSAEETISIIVPSLNEDNIKNQLNGESNYLQQYEILPKYGNNEEYQSSDDYLEEACSLDVSPGYREQKYQERNYLKPDVFPKIEAKVKSKNYKLYTSPIAKRVMTENTHVKFSNKTQYICGMCNRDFSSKNNLKRHLVTHSGVKPYLCKVCQKNFSQFGTLKQLMYTHTGEKPFVCEICKRGFSQYKSLIFHKRRHTGEKPFFCNYCGSHFRQRDSLKTHLKRYHVEKVVIDGVEIYECSICKEHFKSTNDLHKHLNHHLNNEISSNANRLEDISERHKMPTENTEDLQNATGLDMLTACIVDVTTSSTAELSRAKQFKCRECFKSFAIKKNFLNHLLIHKDYHPDILSNADKTLPLETVN